MATRMHLCSRSGVSPGCERCTHSLLHKVTLTDGMDMSTMDTVHCDREGICSVVEGALYKVRCLPVQEKLLKVGYAYTNESMRSRELMEVDGIRVKYADLCSVRCSRRWTSISAWLKWARGARTRKVRQ